MTYRVLIAEPDGALAALYRTALAQAGYEAEVAGDGLACAAKLRGFRPHLLVLEPDLLWGRGEGILALLQEDPDMPRAAVVVVSRLAGFRVDGPEGPRHPHYRKPLSADQIVGIVREHCPGAAGAPAAG